MKKGFAFIAVALVFGGLILVGSGILTARYFLNKNSAENVDTSSKKSSKEASEESSGSDSRLNEDSSETKSNKNSNEDKPKASLQAQTVYTQPQNIYTMTLPKGWQANPVVAVNNYSTTKFTGPEGNISITIGSGKDPIGGCSESSSIALADRTISGCFLLQKGGSKILTRGYTKSKSGLELTIEAYFNSPNAINFPTILETVKTIDIN